MFEQCLKVSRLTILRWKGNKCRVISLFCCRKRIWIIKWLKLATTATTTTTTTTTTTKSCISWVVFVQLINVNDVCVCVHVDVCKLINSFFQDLVKLPFEILHGVGSLWEKKWEINFQEKTCWPKMVCLCNKLGPKLSISLSQDYCRNFLRLSRLLGYLKDIKLMRVSFGKKLALGTNRLFHSSFV